MCRYSCLPLKVGAVDPLSLGVWAGFGWKCSEGETEGQCRCNYGIDGRGQKSSRSPLLSRIVANSSLVFLWTLTSVPHPPQNLHVFCCIEGGKSMQAFCLLIILILLIKLQGLFWHILNIPEIIFSPKLYLEVFIGVGVE